MKITIGGDHGAVELKEEVKMVLHEFEDVRVTDVVSGKADRGIVLCGTGIGISIAANKIDGIRAALCGDVYSAIMSRKHNDANVLAMGGRVTGIGPAGEIVRAWVCTEFEGGRHARRVDKIMALEQKKDS